MSAFIGSALLKRLVSEKSGVPQDEVDKVLSAYDGVVLLLLETGARVRALGSGHFLIRTSKATRKVSPRDGEVMEIPARRKIVFRESRKK